MNLKINWKDPLTIIMSWKYRKVEIQIYGINNKFLFKRPFYTKQKKFISELQPGSKRKKNRITIKKYYRFLFILIWKEKIKIIRKYVYRKFLKKEGLLNEK